MVYPGTLFYRRQRGIPMHSYENRSEIRALQVSWGYLGSDGRLIPSLAPVLRELDTSGECRRVFTAWFTEGAVRVRGGLQAVTRLLTSTPS